MKFKIKATATDVRTGHNHDITGTVTATTATDARTQTIVTAAQHGYDIHGVPEAEEQR